MHERLSEKKKLGKMNFFFENSFFYENKFQGPKGYRAHTCEVHLQHGNSTTKRPFYAFLS